MRRTRVMTIRVSDVEYEMIERLAREMRCSKAEVWRRLLWTVRILYDERLPASKALNMSADLDSTPLAKVLRPLPDLVRILIEEARGEDRGNEGCLTPRRGGGT